jgi:predicted regulator of Ras-like GTPase activity (Roadblock/LC7/MglB family)
MRGAFVVSTEDGLVVEGRFNVDVRAAAVAALAARLFTRAVRSVQEAGFGDVRFLQLDAEKGSMMVAGQGGLLLVAVADPRANPGRARLEVMRAAHELQGAA